MHAVLSCTDADIYRPLQSSTPGSLLHFVFVRGLCPLWAVGEDKQGGCHRNCITLDRPLTRWLTPDLVEFVDGVLVLMRQNVVSPRKVPFVRVDVVCWVHLRRVAIEVHG